MSRDEAAAVIWQMETSERLAALVMTIVQRRPETLAAIDGMLATISLMSKHLSVSNRIGLVINLRDLSDTIERPELLPQH